MENKVEVILLVTIILLYFIFRGLYKVLEYKMKGEPSMAQINAIYKASNVLSTLSTMIIITLCLVLIYNFTI